MTTLEKIMEDRGITYYKLTKKLGLDPNSWSAFVIAKVRGRTKTTPKEMSRFCDAIEQLSGTPIDRTQIDYEVVGLKVR